MKGLLLLSLGVLLSCGAGGACAAPDVTGQGDAPPLTELSGPDCTGPGGDDGVRSTTISGRLFYYCAPGFAPIGFGQRAEINGVNVGYYACGGYNNACPSGFRRTYVVTCCYKG